MDKTDFWSIIIYIILFCFIIGWTIFISIGVIQLLKIFNSDRHFEPFEGGVAYDLYTPFAYFCVICMIILFITNGLINLLANLFSNDCKDRQTILEMIQKGYDSKEICQETFLNSLSLANKRNSVSFILVQDILNFITVISLVIVFQIMRYYLRKFEKKFEKIRKSPADYAIWVSGIPKEFNGNIKKEIENQFKSSIDSIKESHDKQYLFHEFKLIPIDYVVCYDEEGLNLLRSRYKEIKNKQDSEDKNECNIYDQIHDDDQLNKHFIGKAIIIMETQYARDFWIEIQNRSNSCYLYSWNRLKLNNQEVELQIAFESTDINWQNLEVSTIKRFSQVCISSIATILLLIICLIILMLLKKWQISFFTYKTIVDDQGNIQTIIEQTTLGYMFGFIITISIYVINYFLGIILKKLTTFERHQSGTQYNVSLGVKRVYAEFINTVLLMFLINVVFVFVDDPKTARFNIFGSSGFNSFLWQTVITLTFLESISLVLQISKRIERFLGKHSGDHDLTEEYIRIIKIMLFVSFSAPLFPLTIVVALIGLPLMSLLQPWQSYFTNKKPKIYSMSYDLPLQMTELIQVIIPIFCISNIMFSYFLIPGYYLSLLSLLNTAISILNNFLPMDAINRFIFDRDWCGKDQNKSNYHPQCKFVESETYRMQQIQPYES